MEYPNDVASNGMAPNLRHENIIRPSHMQDPSRRLCQCPNRCPNLQNAAVVPPIVVAAPLPAPSCSFSSPCVPQMVFPSGGCRVEFAADHLDRLLGKS